MDLFYIAPKVRCLRYSISVMCSLGIDILCLDCGVVLAAHVNEECGDVGGADAGNSACLAY